MTWLTDLEAQHGGASNAYGTAGNLAQLQAQIIQANNQVNGVGQSDQGAPKAANFSGISPSAFQYFDQSGNLLNNTGYTSTYGVGSNGQSNLIQVANLDPSYILDPSQVKWDPNMGLVIDKQYVNSKAYTAAPSSNFDGLGILGAAAGVAGLQGAGILGAGSGAAADGLGNGALDFATGGQSALGSGATGAGDALGLGSGTAATGAETALGPTNITAADAGLTPSSTVAPLSNTIPSATATTAAAGGSGLLSSLGTKAAGALAAAGLSSLTGGAGSSNAAGSAAAALTGNGTTATGGTGGLGSTLSNLAQAGLSQAQYNQLLQAAQTSMSSQDVMNTANPGSRAYYGNLLQSTYTDPNSFLNNPDAQAIEGLATKQALNAAATSGRTSSDSAAMGISQALAPVMANYLTQYRAGLQSPAGTNMTVSPSAYAALIQAAQAKQTNGAGALGQVLNGLNGTNGTTTSNTTGLDPNVNSNAGNSSDPTNVNGAMGNTSTNINNSPWGSTDGTIDPTQGTGTNAAANSGLPSNLTGMGIGTGNPFDPDPDSTAGLWGTNAMGGHVASGQMAIVGDSPSGKPTGHEEGIIPDGTGGVHVIPHHQMKAMGALSQLGTPQQQAPRFDNGGLFDPNYTPVSDTSGGAPGANLPSYQQNADYATTYTAPQNLATQQFNINYPSMSADASGLSNVPGNNGSTQGYNAVDPLIPAGFGQGNTGGSTNTTSGTQMSNDTGGWSTGYNSVLPNDGQGQPGSNGIGVNYTGPQMTSQQYTGQQQLPVGGGYNADGGYYSYGSAGGVNFTGQAGNVSSGATNMNGNVNSGYGPDMYGNQPGSAGYVGPAPASGTNANQPAPGSGPHMMAMGGYARLANHPRFASGGYFNPRMTSTNYAGSRPVMTSGSTNPQLPSSSNLYGYGSNQTSGYTNGYMNLPVNTSGPDNISSPTPTPNWNSFSPDPGYSTVPTPSPIVNGTTLGSWMSGYGLGNTNGMNNIGRPMQGYNPWGNTNQAPAPYPNGNSGRVAPSMPPSYNQPPRGVNPIVNSGFGQSLNTLYNPYNQTNGSGNTQFSPGQAGGYNPQYAPGQNNGQGTINYNSGEGTGISGGGNITPNPGGGTGPTTGGEGNGSGGIGVRIGSNN